MTRARGCAFVSPCLSGRVVGGLPDARAVGSAGGTTALWAGRPAAPRRLPPPHRTVHAVLPHTAHRHRSPAGKRKRGSHRSAQAMDTEPGCPLVVEAGDPVAALESVLGAGEDREAFVDVAVDR